MRHEGSARGMRYTFRCWGGYQYGAVGSIKVVSKAARMSHDPCVWQDDLREVANSEVHAPISQPQSLPPKALHPTCVSPWLL